MYQIPGAFVVMASLLVAAFAQNPVPQIVGPVKPMAVAPGSGGFTLTVYGANFVPGAVVNWNGQPRTTKFISRRELRAQMLGADVRQNTAGTISVTNPPPGGGNSSASFAQLEVHDPTATINPGPPLVLSSTHGIGYGAVLVADFNGDGVPDLFGDGISWLGRGDGTFKMGWSSQTYYDPFGLVYGDFNNDGKLDLAYIGFDQNNPNNPPRELRVMQGDGTGRFHPAWLRWDNSGLGFYWPAAGDFNGDGKLDLAVVRQNKLDIFLGNGDGTFLNFVEILFPGVGNGIQLVAGDFNGDGKLDLVTEDQYGEVYLLVGKGDGTFRYPAKALTSFTPGACRLEAVSDFNADGKLDLVMECQTARESGLEVMIGNGNGTFQQPLMYQLAPEFPVVAVGDFNSDGNTDILVVQPGQTDYLSIFLGNGDGSFKPQQLVPVVNNFVGENGMYAGDFNRDGLTDFFTVSAYFEGIMYLQN